MPIIKAKVLNEDSNIRLDRWFRRHYQDFPYVVLLKLIRKGQIRIDGKRAKASDKLASMQEIRFPLINFITQEEKNTIPYIEKNFKKLKEEFLKTIIMQDDNLIAINKPEGMLVQGGTKIKVSLDALAEKIYESGVKSPKVVHRLDKDTSGVLILAKGSSIAAKLSALIRERRVKKTYIAILQNVPKLKQGEITTGLLKTKVEKNYERVKVTDSSNKKSITKYKVLDTHKNLISLVQMSPITGRTHQLRVHSAELGCPILGDKKYGKNEIILPDFQYKKLFLHAYALEFTIDGKSYNIKAPLPLYFERICEKYNLKKLD